MKVNVVKSVLKANDVIAENNRDFFKENGAVALNIMSSPGSGKTTLLEKTISTLNSNQKSVVIVGDLETSRDADRLSKYASEVTQINTGLSCHLYANQIDQAAKQLDLTQTDYVFIENVGNMVCPGEFDLGENLKVALLSVCEGDDKVAKYPTIFRVADIILITKIDLFKVVDFDLDHVEQDIRKLNKNAPVLKISSKTAEGFDQWIDWLKEKRQQCVGAKAKFIQA